MSENEIFCTSVMYNDFNVIPDSCDSEKAQLSDLQIATPNEKASFGAMTFILISCQLPAYLSLSIADIRTFFLTTVAV